MPMTWDEAPLSGLQAHLAHELLGRATAFALGPEARLVRGVVAPPGRSDVGRVVVWDGRRLDSSLAFDVPLTDASGGNIPPDGLAAALRAALADHSAPEAERAPRDHFGIPVLDASATVHAFLARPRFHPADALHAAAAAFAVPPEPAEPAELRLRGFLLLDEATYRLYLDTPDARDVPPFGVDLPVRDADGSVLVGVTAVHAALQVLLREESERLRKDVHDPYARTVHDLTHWLTGR